MRSDTVRTITYFEMLRVLLPESTQKRILKDRPIPEAVLRHHKFLPIEGEDPSPLFIRALKKELQEFLRCDTEDIQVIRDFPGLKGGIFHVFLAVRIKGRLKLFVDVHADIYLAWRKDEDQRLGRNVQLKKALYGKVYSPEIPFYHILPEDMVLRPEIVARSIVEQLFSTEAIKDSTTEMARIRKEIEAKPAPDFNPYQREYLRKYTDREELPFGFEWDDPSLDDEEWTNKILEMYSEREKKEGGNRRPLY